MYDLSEADRHWIDIAINMSQLSELRCKHAAVLTRGSKLISMAFNRPRNTPRLVSDRFRFNRPGWNAASIHAEVAALKMASWQTAQNSTLYVVRYGHNGSLTESSPCKTCMPYIRKRGVKKVIYSTFDGDFRVERI